MKKKKRKVVLKESPVERMGRLGRLNVWEMTAADDLVRAFRTSAGLGASRDPLLGSGDGPRFGMADAAAVGRIDAIEQYRRWRRDLSGSGPLVAAVSILFDENTLRETEDTYHWRHGHGGQLLIAALRHFAALRGNTPRGARDWKFKKPCA